MNTLFKHLFNTKFFIMYISGSVLGSKNSSLGNILLNISFFSGCVSGDVINFDLLSR